MTTPTIRTTSAFTAAYNHFNQDLFGGSLPQCLITLQRKNRAYGYFASQRFGSRDDSEITDEIAMNPSHFKDRSTEDVLSTLAHEMAHLWQQHFGTPSRSAYHNKEWAAKMKEIGLHPSSTGQPGGKETGQKVSHYIITGGAFERSCAALIETGFTLPYVERWSEGQVSTKKKKAASKTKFTCPSCGANAWGKPDLNILCGDCDVAMDAEQTNTEESIVRAA